MGCCCPKPGKSNSFDSLTRNPVPINDDADNPRNLPIQSEGWQNDIFGTSLTSTSTNVFRESPSHPYEGRYERELPRGTGARPKQVTHHKNINIKKSRDIHTGNNYYYNIQQVQMGGQDIDSSGDWREVLQNECTELADRVMEIRAVVKRKKQKKQLDMLRQHTRQLEMISDLEPDLNSNHIEQTIVKESNTNVSYRDKVSSTIRHLAPNIALKSVSEGSIVVVLTLIDRDVSYLEDEISDSHPLNRVLTDAFLCNEPIKSKFNQESGLGIYVESVSSGKILPEQTATSPPNQLSRFKYMYEDGFDSKESSGYHSDNRLLSQSGQF